MNTQLISRLREYYAGALSLSSVRSTEMMSQHELQEPVDTIDDEAEVLYLVNMRTLRLIHISATCKNVYGYSAQDFLSHIDLWRKTIHPDDRDISESRVRCLYEGKTVYARYRIISKEGTIRWIENREVPTLDASGRLVRVNGTSRAITERTKDLDESAVTDPVNKIIYDLPVLYAHA
jgi:PAS domain S-box-containing protein